MRKKILTSSLTCLLLSCLSANSHAYAWSISSGWWAAIEGGYSFSTSSHHTNTYQMPGVDLPDNYVTNSMKNTGILGVGLGYQFIFPPSCKNVTSTVYWLPANRLGVYYDYLFPAKLSGYIQKWQSVDVYHFNYRVHSNTLWLDDQLDIFRYCNFTPFLEAGIGLAWNQASAYHEYPFADVPAQNVRCASADFASKSSTGFAYRLGAGINYQLNCHFNLGVLYRYQNLGKVNTGHSANYPSVGKLSTNLGANQVLINLRYN